MRLIMAALLASSLAFAQRPGTGHGGFGGPGGGSNAGGGFGNWTTGSGFGNSGLGSPRIGFNSVPNPTISLPSPSIGLSNVPGVGFGTMATPGSIYGTMATPGQTTFGNMTNPRVPVGGVRTGRPASRGGGFGGGRGHNSGVVVLPYPVAVGPYLDSGYDAPSGYYTGAPNGYGYDPGYGAPPQTPVIIINQGYQPERANPVMHDYSNTQLSDPTLKIYEQPSHPFENAAAADTPAADAPPQIVFLIAMKNHTIFPAIAFWVDGDTLHYITMQGVQNSASLTLVDRDFTRQLNKERNLDFNLPPGR